MDIDGAVEGTWKETILICFKVLRRVSKDTYHLFTTKSLSVTEMGSTCSTSGEEETRIQSFMRNLKDGITWKTQT